MKDFEKKAYGMGLNKGMFAVNNKGEYVSSVTRKLYDAYKQGKLTALLVNSFVQDLK